MLENIHLAFQGIWGHKMRSLLTMLGIIIGIAAIITIVSTIKGTNEQIKENLIGAGNNVVTVQLYADDYPFDLSYNDLPGDVRVITEDTLEELRNIAGVEDVSLYTQREYSEQVFYLNTRFSGAAYGIDRNFLSVQGYQTMRGRGFTDQDYRLSRKVVLVDDKAAKSLFAGADPIGKCVEIQREVFTVVGVVTLVSDFVPTISSYNDYALYADTSTGAIFLPSTSWPTAYRFDEPQSVALRVRSTDDMTSVGKEAADLLTQRQIIGAESTFSYRSKDMLKQAEQLQNMSRSTNIQLIWIASISLLVGGIGVMNIMLVSVTERTNEIGLKKAIGARRKKIRMQFLTEAVVLTSLGGIIGVISGIILAELISGMMKIPVAISPPAILIAVLFSMGIGIVFGFVPAAKAANLDPIQALRRD